jgi:hypothetical protein
MSGMNRCKCLTSLRKRAREVRDFPESRTNPGFFPNLFWAKTQYQQGFSGIYPGKTAYIRESSGEGLSSSREGLVAAGVVTGRDSLPAATGPSRVPDRCPPSTHDVSRPSSLQTAETGGHCLGRGKSCSPETDSSRSRFRYWLVSLRPSRRRTVDRRHFLNGLKYLPNLNLTRTAQPARP